MHGILNIRKTNSETQQRRKKIDKIEKSPARKTRFALHTRDCQRESILINKDGRAPRANMDARTIAGKQ